MKSLKEQIREVISDAKVDGDVVDVQRTAEVLAGTPEHRQRVEVIAEAVILEGVRQRAGLEIPPARRRAGRGR